VPSQDSGYDDKIIYLASNSEYYSFFRIRLCKLLNIPLLRTTATLGWYNLRHYCQKSQIEAEFWPADFVFPQKAVLIFLQVVYRDSNMYYRLGDIDIVLNVSKRWFEPLKHPLSLIEIRLTFHVFKPSLQVFLPALDNITQIVNYCVMFTLMSRR